MSKDHLDENRPATLHNGAVSTDFPTLQDAIQAWNRLRPEQARKASIRIIGGQLYQPADITEASEWVEVKGRLRRLHERAATDEATAFHEITQRSKIRVLTLRAK